MNRKVLGHGDRLGVSTVGGPAGERAVLAQVLLTAPAVLADTVGPVQPAHANPLPDVQARRAFAESIDSPDHLVSGDDGQLGEVELTGDDVQVGAATRAHVNSEDPIFNEPLAIPMLIDIFSERGYHAVVDKHIQEVPERVDLATGTIRCRSKVVYRIEISFEASKIRRG